MHARIIKSAASGATQHFLDTGKSKFSGLDINNAKMRVAMLHSATADGAFDRTRHFVSGDFGNDPQFWLSLQLAFDLAFAKRQNGERIARDVIPAA